MAGNKQNAGKDRSIAVTIDRREVVHGKTGAGVPYSYQCGLPLTSPHLLTTKEELVAAGEHFLTAKATIDGQPDFEVILVPGRKRAGVAWTISQSWGWVDARTIREAVEAFSECETFGQSKQL